MEWIKVTDRLPIDYNRYLCLRMNDEQQCYIEDVCLFDSQDKEWIFQKKEVVVSHWMELPNVPAIYR